MTLSDLVARQQRRDRLIHLVCACVVALALVLLATTGPADSVIAGLTQ